MAGSEPEPTMGQSSDRPPGLPGWAKLVTIGALIAIAVLVVVMLFVGGDHGPGMHGG